jgi:DNA polymerase
LAVIVFYYLTEEQLMSDLVMDFETKSSLNLNQRGMMNYLHTEESDIICLTYKIDNEPTQLWLPGLEVPFKSLNDFETVSAFKAEFDFGVWNVLGRKLYGFPLLPLSKVVDVRAICARLNLPMQLKEVAKVLKLKFLKHEIGGLMEKITQPPFHYTPAEERQFLKYAVRDTDTLHELIHTLPFSRLSESEQQVWEDTAKINFTGVPIDVESVNRIYYVAKQYIREAGSDIGHMTGEAVQKITQTVALRKWANSMLPDNFPPMPDFGKDTVEKYKNMEGLPKEVKDILEMRLELNASSISKYKAMQRLHYRGKIYEPLVYHKAGPGRWAGQGAQMQNYPRATLDPEEHGQPKEVIQKFYDMTILDNPEKLSPVFAAKALLRTMIKAPEGHIFGVYDYAGVEKNGLLWTVQDEEALAEIRNGMDQYKSMASDLYDIPYDTVDSKQRFMGKTLVLGCGYNLGGKGFQEYAKGFGLDISREQADYGVEQYRSKYPLVREFWYRVKDCAIAAIEHPGKVFEFKKCTFVVRADRSGNTWLINTLPSGRDTYYFQPKVIEGKYGPVPSNMGMDSKTHQWVRRELIPGRITENIIQGICSDILRFHIRKLLSLGHKIVLHVHDEIIDMFKLHEAEEKFAEQKRIMKLLPPWAVGFPLEVEGELMHEYKKM